MKNFRILALAIVLLAFQKIPAQDVVFKAQTRLVVVNVTSRIRTAFRIRR